MDILNKKSAHRIISIGFGLFLLLAASLVFFSVLVCIFTPGTATALFSSVGNLLYGAYGFSALLVSFVLFWASLLLLIPGWSFKSQVLLSTSIIPFFTIAFGERILRSIKLEGASEVLGSLIKAGIVVTLVLVVCIEIFIFLFFTEFIEKKVSGIKKEKLNDGSHTDFSMEAPIEDSSLFEASVDSELTGESMNSNVFEIFGIDTSESPSIEELESLEGSFESCQHVDKEETSSGFLVPKASVKPEAEIEETFAFASGLIESLPILVDELEGSDDFNDLDEPSDFMSDSSVSSFEQEILENSTGSAKGLRAVAELVRQKNAEESFLEEGEESSLEYDVDINTAIEIEDDVFDEQDDTIDDDLERELDLEPEIISIPPAPKVGELTGTEIVLDAGKSSLFGRKKKLIYTVPYDILTSYPDGEYWIVDDATRRSAVALKETLNEFRIEADVTGIKKGPVITMFEILPAPGVKLSKIVGLQDNIALRLAASSVRIVAPIPGKHAVGIEVPNAKRSIVSFRELIEADILQAKKMEIPVVLGKDITGDSQLLDLAATPHLLIAGSTGSGKSVCVNSIILSILYKRSPEDVKLILIDPKIVELKLYNDIGHLLTPVITEPKKAFQALQYCLCEMERRYALLDGMGVRDIKSYNRRIKERNIATEKIPYLVVIIDEFADLMATTGKELESTVARLCAMSRAVGIHLVLATQRPSIDVITGLIKANIPTRIAFMVASKMDSRIIIDQVGAEKLLGKGDMLYASATDPFPVRIQGAFVSEEEVERVVEHVKTLGEPEYIDEEIFVEDDDDTVIEASLFSDGEDPLYDKALEIVLLAGKASASYIQRKLKIGYNRAARLVEDMEARGIVGPANGSKPREVLHRP